MIKLVLTDVPFWPKAFAKPSDPPSLTIGMAIFDYFYNFSTYESCVADKEGISCKVDLCFTWTKYVKWVPVSFSSAEICYGFHIRYFVLTASDLEEWHQNPESFHHEQDAVLWSEKLRPCAEALYIVLFHNHSHVGLFINISLFYLIIFHLVAYWFQLWVFAFCCSC